MSRIFEWFKLRTMTVALLVGSTALLGSCATTQQEEETVVSVPEVTNLAFMEDGVSPYVRIDWHGDLTFQAFEMNQPRRIVINLPGARLSENVNALSQPTTWLSSVVPQVRKELSGSSVRIELALVGPVDFSTEPVPGGGLKVRLQTRVMGANGDDRLQVGEFRLRDVVDGTEIVLPVSGQWRSDPKVFQLKGPQRLVIDLDHAVSRMQGNRFVVESPRVKTIQIGQYDDRLRIVVSLAEDRELPFQVQKEGNNLKIRLGLGATASSGEVVSVEDVKFKKVDGIAQIEISLNKAGPTVEAKRDGENLILNISNSRLGMRPKRMTVADFETEVSTLDVYQSGESVQLVAQVSNRNAQHQLFTQGRKILLRVMTPQKARELAGLPPTPEYVGEPLSLNFNDLEIHEALKIIAEYSGLNIIASDEVTGSVTLKLDQVPWDQALDLILSAKDLVKERIGNVIHVMRAADLQKRKATQAQAETTLDALYQPMVIEVVPVFRAKASDLKDVLDSLIQAGAKTKGKTTVQAGGATATGAADGQPQDETNFESAVISVDARTNALIIRDQPRNIAKLRELISKLDSPTPQVLIEARIVEARNNFNQQLGIAWGGQFSRQNSVFNFPASVGIQGINGTSSSSLSGGGGLLVNLPASSGSSALGISLASLDGKISLDLELSAMESANQAKIVSSPRVITTQNVEATITQGQQVPYQTTSAAGTQTQFADATLTLKATPTVTPDHQISLDLSITKNSVDTATAAGAAGPSINTKTLTTHVLVKNGDTVVLGGIFEQNKSEQTEGVPLLSRLPFFGWLFKRNTDADIKSELLIFITPKIVNIPQKVERADTSL
ncbi:MAG: hypothetical protein AUJ55_12640 [Proteobacteria bacterium CG1_02_64_396]|nr:MAG: hypothetical protein AUJ55_12640 [Proteobacteria bacterium CG1_02_64_396]